VLGTRRSTSYYELLSFHVQSEARIFLEIRALSRTCAVPRRALAGRLTCGAAARTAGLVNPPAGGIFRVMASGEFSSVLLAQAVAECLHLPPEKLSFRRCATGKFNTTWFVAGGPEPLVLRVAPPDDPARVLFYEYRMMRQEPDLHQRLRRETSIPVPAILATSGRTRT
jgi:hypothetical protein